MFTLELKSSLLILLTMYVHVATISLYTSKMPHIPVHYNLGNGPNVEHAPDSVLGLAFHLYPFNHPWPPLETTKKS